MEQKYEGVKKEDESSDEEEQIQYRNPYIDSLDFAFLKSEGDDTVDQSCITSSESTVEQFDQLDVNTDDYVDSSELLISEVQKRPLLYDISLEDYNDRNKKAKCWEEVYKQMITNWSELSSAEKNNRGRIIQKRWRSIRDSFMKAYKKMNKIQNKKSTAKRKRYVYFDQMMFIIPSIEKRKNNELMNNEDSVPHSKPESNADEESTRELAVYEQVEPINKPSSRNRQEKNSGEVNFMDLVEEYQHKNIKPCEIDDDRMFLLSLLSSFKKMTHDIKLGVRIEILQIIRQALRTNTTYSSVTQTSQTYPITTVTETTQNSTEPNFTNTTQQSNDDQWSCQENITPSPLTSWPVPSSTEPLVESQILDLMQ